MSQGPLPPAPAPATFPTAQDLADIQGDVVLGIPKRYEDFLFFNIKNVAEFKKDLKTLIPLITTTAQIQQVRKDIEEHKQGNKEGLLKVIGINISFTYAGLKKFGVFDALGDTAFEAGQFSHAQVLQDPGSIDASGDFHPDWLPAFKGEVDGLVLVAADGKHSVDEGAAKVLHIIGDSIRGVLRVEGNVRPGKEKGHEHFGFMDGISNPAIDAITGHLPGQNIVDPGIILVGQQGDPVKTPTPGGARPSWAKNGSFLVYRHLNQLVPEFHKFLRDNPLDLPGLPRDQGSELLGARLVGRWKSGAPIDIAPLQDDPVLAADPQRNNNFDFSGETDQTKCPFSAHVRKTNPRTDLSQFGAAALKNHLFIRQGIPFGPEVSHEEETSGRTRYGVNRGLSFVSYQSSIDNGFEFVQKQWANNVNFPPKQNFAEPGFDPIVGQNGVQPREVFGTNPKAQGNELKLPFDFVVSKGGAYFFAPSLTALNTKLSV